MPFLKINSPSTIALTAAALVVTVSIGTALGSTKRAHHKAHRTHKIAKTTAVAEPWFTFTFAFTPLTCGMRYYGGPKGGLWPAPCPPKEEIKKPHHD